MIRQRNIRFDLDTLRERRELNESIRNSTMNYNERDLPYKNYIINIDSDKAITILKSNGGTVFKTKQKSNFRPLYQLVGSSFYYKNKDGYIVCIDIERCIESLMTKVEPQETIHLDKNNIIWMGSLDDIHVSILCGDGTFYRGKTLINLPKIHLVPDNGRYEVSEGPIKLSNDRYLLMRGYVTQDEQSYMMFTVLDRHSNVILSVNVPSRILEKFN